MRSKRPGRARGAVVPVWWRSALHAWEIALAAPEVVAHRTSRMVRAAHTPDAWDREEFTRMGQEKLEALTESLIGMAMPLYTFNVELASLAPRQWWRWWQPWTSLNALAASRSPVEVAEAQAALMRNLMATAGDERLTDAFSRVVQKGLAPVHRRATRNAKRLRGVRPR